MSSNYANRSFLPKLTLFQNVCHWRHFCRHFCQSCLQDITTGAFTIFLQFAIFASDISKDICKDLLLCNFLINGPISRIKWSEQMLTNGISDNHLTRTWQDLDNNFAALWTKLDNLLTNTWQCFDKYLILSLFSWKIVQKLSLIGHYRVRNLKFATFQGLLQ